MSNLTKVYEGADLSGSVTGIIFLPILMNGLLTGVGILCDGNVSGSDVTFVLRQNGSIVATGTMLIAVGANTKFVTGLRVAVSVGDEMTLDMSGGGADAPITLNLEIEDAQSLSMGEALALVANNILY